MTRRTITFDDAEWQIVPRELTENMRTEMYEAHHRYSEQSAWEGILDAAPEPPAQPRRPYGTDTMSEYGVIPECDGPEPPAQEPMTDEEIDAVTGSARDALLDHLYEYGTTSEGAQRLVRMLARAVERHHNIGKGESND